MAIAVDTRLRHDLTMTTSRRVHHALRSRDHGPSRRGAAVTAAVVALSLVFGPVVSAQPDEDAAEQAAREIAAAQDRANAAAEAFLFAESELETLEDEAAALEREQAALQAEVDGLRTQVEAAAVQRFMGSGSDGIPILTGYAEPLEQLQTDVLSAVATGASDDAFDAYDVASVDLDDKSEELAAAQADVESQQQRFDELRDAAVAEVETLEQVEADRLEDERVRLALEAQRREEQRVAEAARQAEQEQLAAQQRAAAEEQQRNALAQAAVPAVSQQAEPAGQADPSGGANALPAAPQPESAESEPEVDDTEPESAPPPASSGMACPIRGSYSYADTWGAPRSGGRRHEGVDMIASTGTTLVAVVSGSVQFKQNSLGGNAVWLAGNDGARYYYAHLSSFEGSSRSVGQGEVIGYVGDSGNARGTPHLHFEVHPGGGAAVNPTPYVRNAGC